MLHTSWSSLLYAFLARVLHIIRASLVVAAADGAVALIAGLAIFPIVFAHGLSPAEGPGLIFATLPVAFGRMAASKRSLRASREAAVSSSPNASSRS